MRIGVYVFAAVLLGLPAMQASFAEDAHPRVPDRGRSGQSAQPTSPAPLLNNNSVDGAANHGEPGRPKTADAPAKADGNTQTDAHPGTVPPDDRHESRAEHPRAVDESETAGAAAKNGHVNSVLKELGPIDTTIAVQPDHTAGTSGEASNRKKVLTIVGPKNFQVSRSPAPGVPDLIVRNAIGLPVTPHQLVRGDNGEPFNSSAAHPLAAVTNRAGSIFTASRSIGGMRSAGPILTLTGTPSGNGRIDGTGLIHPGASPMGIGGPAPAIAGINGTAFRPKH